MRRLFRPLAAALVLAVVLVLVVRTRDGAAAPTSSSIARGLPAGAVTYLETPELRALLAAWHDSKPAAALAGSAADEDMRRGMLWLRLADRLGALEQLAGFELTYERLQLLVGKEAGLAVYDLASTRFVLATRLADAEFARTPLAQAKKRFASRRHAGLEYFVQEKGPARTLAFAFVGDRLLVGNDLEHFHDALVLTARVAGVKLDAKVAVPAALGDDADYKGLLASSPTDVSLRVYVREDAIVGTHHFDDFWIFGWAAPDGVARHVDGIAASLLSLRLTPGGARETRVHLLKAGATASVAKWPTADRLPGQGGIGLVDANAAGLATLPPGLSVTVDALSPARLADRVLRLLPVADDAAGARGKAAKQLAEIFAAAGAGRSLEIISLDPRLRRSGALAVRVADPARIDATAAEAALLAPLSASFGRCVPLAFAGTAGERQLVVPLLPGAEWALTIVPPRAGAPWWIVATSPTVARDAARALGDAKLAHLLDDDAPLAQRVDVAGARARWTAISGALTDGPWASTEASRFVGETVPALLAATGLTRVDRVTYRAGVAYRVEQVDFLW
jgi:hypothetical protein